MMLHHLSPPSSASVTTFFRFKSSPQGSFAHSGAENAEQRAFTHLNTNFDHHNSGMEGRLIVLLATLTVFVASGVQGTAHLSFASNREVNITRDGCANSKLCLEVPDDCDPSTNGTCLFVSFVVSAPMPPDGANLSVQLTGNNNLSRGYFALGLTGRGSTMLFACARNGSDNATFFRTLMKNSTSNMFSPEEIRVTEIRIRAKDDVIRCEFNVPRVNASQSRNSDVTTFTVTAGPGALTESGGIGSFNPTFNRTVDLRVMPTTTTTAAPTTTPSGAASNAAFHSHALLILLSVLTLFTVLRA